MIKALIALCDVQSPRFHMSLQFQQFPVRKLSKVLVKCGGDESAVLEIVEEFHRKRDISWCFFLPLPPSRISSEVYLI